MLALYQNRASRNTLLVLSVFESNLLVAEKSLALTFKNPWQYVADFNSNSLRTFADNEFSPHREEWRCLLDKVRTFFAENPAV
jgi:hypothetical protein